MNCPLHRTTVLGFDASRVASGDSIAFGSTGDGPAMPNRGNWSGFVGKRTYRLAETTPTA